MKLQIRKSLSENELIKACRKKNSKAQKELYDKYAPTMLGLCCRYVNSRQDAEDVMLTGFVKVFEKLGTYEGKGSFEGWMKKIMINEALGFLRKNKTMYLEVDIEKAEKVPNMEVLSNTLEADDLMTMIKELPAGYRTIFNLFAIEGYSHKEIGEMLNINVNTSKSQLNRARTCLQNKLSATEAIMNEIQLDHGDK